MKKDNNGTLITKSLTFTSQRHTDVECITHIHAHMEIVLVTDGILHMTISGKEYDIPSGYGTFIAPFEPHTFHSLEPNKCLVIMFSSGLAGSFSEYTSRKCITSHIFAISNESLGIAERTLPDETCKRDNVYAEAVIAPLCLDAYLGCAFEDRVITDDGTVLEIFDYMYEHFKEELSLDKVAAAIGVHPVTVSKAFSKYTGVGFNYYVKYLRCIYASSLIEKSGLSFTEIAYESGFGSVRSFNRAFLEIFQKTPSDYKRG